MDTLLKNKDHAVGDNGLPISLTGTNEILQRAIIRLSVKKGSFPYDESLGSELYKLSGDGESTKRQALSYVQEALRPLPELDVVTVGCHIDSAHNLTMNCTLKNRHCKKEPLIVE